MEFNFSEKFIKKLIKFADPSSREFLALQRNFAKETKQPFISNDRLLQSYHKLIASGIIKENKKIESFLKLKNTRSSSGIVVISVLTKPFPCPGNCLYCPTEPSVPKSYLSNEPAVMRAIMCKYHPFRQVEMRLKALEAVGHLTDKINIRIIGGTWSAYPKQYQTWFVKELFEAANKIHVSGNTSLTALENLQLANETAKHRIVEISIETRQDYISHEEILRLRKLSVTKVELGVQSLYDDVLLLNRRGNQNQDTIAATKLLKDAGFKVSYQMMANLPGSSIERDKAMFKTLFEDPDFRPDHLKIYPLALVKNAPVYDLYQAGKYRPYNDQELTDLLIEIKKEIPRYCRIERVIRDIPATEIVEGGSKISNLRQIVQNKMAAQNLYCQCIRCREVKNNYDSSEEIKLFREDCDASSGREIFLSIENASRNKLYAILRLRIPSAGKIGVLKNSAIIREIHTYGNQAKLGVQSENSPQHHGFGKSLVKEAEKIALEEFDKTRVAVIAGVGVRGYFRKLGYELEATYMVKNNGRYFIDYLK